jgi:ubiquinone/menaquinone biosynthesis C-methylase UbiE
MTPLAGRQRINTEASYEFVAREYYDAGRHPTCANFREASRILLSKWLLPLAGSRHVCEIGAGKSIAAEILSNKNRRLDGLTLVDESPCMLSYSKRWIREGASLEIGAASHLPLEDEQVDVLVSCLGDPYNHVSLWREASRVLKHEGVCLYTTPSHDWAKNFRLKTHSYPDSAQFDLLDGTQVLLPSFILPTEKQTALVNLCGLEIRRIAHVLIRDLSGQKLSPKLVLDRGPDASVVTGYRISKP